MAFFKFRSSGRGSSQAELNSSAETVEAMRRRARHRLIGAAVLVALGVIGFPLLFDTQPRPVAVDIPIEIPDKNKSAPAVAPPVASVADADRLASAGNTAARQGAAADATVPAHSSLDSREQLVGAGTPKAVAPAAAVPDKAAADKAADKAVANKAAAEKKVEKKPEPAAKPESDSRPEAQKKTAVAKAERPVDKSRDKAPPDKNQDKAATAASEKNQSDLPPASRDELRAARAEEAARARALLQGRSEKEAAAIAEGRFIVQVGAFSEPGLAQATRAKVERAGLKTYTQEARTANGTWIRVRVGPFATRAEANAAASKIKGLSLPASILTL